MTYLTRPPDWTEQAACTPHPDLWHSPHLTHQAIATTICAHCPVQTQCLRDYGHEPHGIIAGLCPTDRGRLLGITPSDVRAPHGTRSRYIGSRRFPGCRCLECHEAHASYERGQRAKRRAAKLAAKSGGMSLDDGKLNE